MSLSMTSSWLRTIYQEQTLRWEWDCPAANWFSLWLQQLGLKCSSQFHFLTVNLIVLVLGLTDNVSANRTWHFPTITKTYMHCVMARDNGSSEGFFSLRLCPFFTPTAVMVSVGVHCLNISGGLSSMAGVVSNRTASWHWICILSVFLICSGLVLWLQPSIDCVSSWLWASFTVWLSRKWENNMKLFWRAATGADFLN